MDNTIIIKKINLISLHLTIFIVKYLLFINFITSKTGKTPLNMIMAIYKYNDPISNE